ncbi:MAG: hypothetical protein ACLRZ9_03345 [Eubacterium sp.]
MSYKLRIKGGKILKSKWKGIIISIIIFLLIILVSCLIHIFYITIDIKDTSKVSKEISQELLKSTQTECSNINIVSTFKEKNYVAIMSTYKLDKKQYISCFYFKRNRVFKGRYEICGGISDIKYGTVGYTCISDTTENVILVAGYNLPDEAKKYSVKLVEDETEIIKDINNNYILKLISIDTANQSSINIKVELLDENYRRIK